jgi:hypothetical protein
MGANVNPDVPNTLAPVFRGSVQNATYKEQMVARYRSNPLIEGLPNIRSAAEAAKLMAYYPKRDPQAHKFSQEIRMHLIMDAVHFFEPFPVHLDLELRISRVIRDGYAYRNPGVKPDWRDLDQKVDVIVRGGGIPLQSASVNGFSVIGLPGTGKSTGVERVLQLCPQILYHREYGGVPFCRTQFAWLKLGCPPDGSVKNLCVEFFRVIDCILGTNYQRDCAANGRKTVDELIPGMARIAWIHCLGVLVIDEIQHLNQAKSGGAEQMLNFFLHLMNTLNLPVILIGTNAALPILTQELRQIRRSCGQGDLIWDRMVNDGLWKLFVESLWRFDYTLHQAPLSQVLADALYYESAGIVDFAVKLYLLAQGRAISTGIEKITSGIIHSVSRDSLRLAQPALRALRTGNMTDEAVATMTDLHSIDFASAMQEVRKNALLEQLSANSRIVSDVNATAQVQDPSGDAAGQPDKPDVSSLPARRVNARRSRETNGSSKCLLVQLVTVGASKGTSPHDTLAAEGIIQPFSEFQHLATHSC